MNTQRLLSDVFPKFADVRPGSRVGIVGAGFSGLCCAYELRAAGYDVQLFEARNRLGGRVHSLNDFVPVKTVEAGGELIGSKHRLWLKYAKRFQLVLEGLEVPGEEELATTICLRGKVYQGNDLELLEQEIEIGHAALAEDARSELGRAVEVGTATELDARAVAQWLQELNISEAAKFAIQTEFAHDMAVDLNKMNYLALLCVIQAHGCEQYWAETENYRCSGGNQQLAIHFANAISSESFHFNCPIAAISATADEMQLEEQSGKIHLFDDIVLAVPPSVWNRIRIEPALPASLSPQMGTAVKSLSHVDQRFWRSITSADSMADTAVGMTWEDPLPAEQGAVLMSFAGGPYADAAHAFSNLDRNVEYSKDLENVLPGYNEHLIQRRFVDWIAEEWTRCGYSFPLPGKFLQQAQQLHSGFGRLHFAGEHASFGFTGFMEGALDAGVSVALRLAKRDQILTD